MTTSPETPSRNELEQFRFAKGTDIRAIKNLEYMMQLMASLEALRASLRWFEHVKDVDSVVWGRDIIIAVIAGAG